MTVVAVSAQNIRLDAAEATTDWGNIGGGAGGALETDFFYQGSNCFARKGATASRGIFLSDNVDSDISGAGTYNTVMFKAICTTPGLLDLLSVPGFKVSIGHGSVPATPSVNFFTYDLHGSDTYPIRSSWLIIPIDPNVSAHRSSTTGTPDMTIADYYALEYDQTAVSKSPNQALDAVDIGAGLTLVSGDGADPDGTWQDFIDFDEDTSSNRFGYVTSFEGVIFVFGNLIIGTATATVFNDSGITIVFPDGLFAEGFSGIAIDLASATTDVDFTDSNFFGKGSAAGEETRPNLTVTNTSGAFDANNCLFDAFNIITLTSGATLQDCVISGGVSLVQAGGTINGCTISGITSAFGAYVISDNPGLIDSCDFISSGNGHAIEITATGTYAMDGVTYSGYGISGDAEVFNNSGGLVTLNITNGLSPIIRNGSGASTVINNNITGTVTVKDTAGAVIVSARVSVRKDLDNTELFGGLTNGSGIVTASHAANAGAVSVRVRKGSGGATDYIPVNSPQTVGSGDFDVTITMIEDTVNAN